MEAALVLGVQEVPGSNPGSPTKLLIDLQPGKSLKPHFWSPTGVHFWTPGAMPRSSFGFVLCEDLSLEAGKNRPQFLRSSLLSQKPDKPDKSNLTHSFQELS